MEAAIEKFLSAAYDAKLHGEMCRQLARLVIKMMKIFPAWKQHVQGGMHY